jgi:hypothetical protein
VGGRPLNYALDPMFGPTRAVLEAHRHCSQHREEIEVSTVCGCFYCLATFLPSEIEDWVDWPEEEDELPEPRGTSALCPRCGIDSVIGSASGFPITEAFLSDMHSHWFGESITSNIKRKMRRLF